MTQNQNVLKKSHQKTKISYFTQTPPTGFALFHADRQTDRRARIPTLSHSSQQLRERV
jgi:hypothetical protein